MATLGDVTIEIVANISMDATQGGQSSLSMVSTWLIYVVFTQARKHYMLLLSPEMAI
jgi:hypothetical protein